MQARIVHKEQALLLSSRNLGILVIIGNLVAYQPPAVSAAKPSDLPLEKFLQTAAEINQAAEGVYNDAMLQFEQVRHFQSVRPGPFLSGFVESSPSLVPDFEHAHAA